MWHASHELLDVMAVFDGWETHRSVFFFQHVVIPPLNTVLYVPTLGIFVLFTLRKRVVGIVL